jgi:hypothetical protein
LPARSILPARNSPDGRDGVAGQTGEKQMLDYTTTEKIRRLNGCFRRSMAFG